MSSHLSQDQLSRCILGQAGPDEQEHSRNCPTCHAEFIRFQESVAAFHGVMKNWSERETIPRFEEIKGASSRSLRSSSLRWAFAGVAAAVLATLPIYMKEKPEPGGESIRAHRVEVEENEDVLLMEEVRTHLSRPIPMPMERVMVLLPTEDASLLEGRDASAGEETP
jgi:hypothetical protein